MRYLSCQTKDLLIHKLITKCLYFICTFTNCVYHRQCERNALLFNHMFKPCNIRFKGYTKHLFNTVSKHHTVHCPVPCFFINQYAFIGHMFNSMNTNFSQLFKLKIDSYADSKITISFPSISFKRTS